MGFRGAHDLLGSLTPLLPNDRHGIDAAISWPLTGEPHDVVYCLSPAANSLFPVSSWQIRQRYKRSDGLAGTLDDQPLACGGLVQELTEVLPNVQR
jgi:hypothetical protein